jgi:integrase
MQSKNPRDRKRAKSKSGTVQIRCSNDRLQLVFTFGGQRRFLSLGLSDTPYHRKLAQDRALEIERDIQYGEFDPTLKKYKPQSVLSTTDPVAQIAQTPLTLANLWDKYVAYRSPKVLPKTIEGTYNPVTVHLEKCSVDGLIDPLKLRMELLKVTTQDQARRTLMQLSAACKWGKKYHFVSTNPFESMYMDLEATIPDPPVAFTVEERDRIIAAFETHTGKGINYQHYAPFVKFLFWTGCRPCEAVGLRWGSITADCGKIHFHESIVEVSGKMERRTKTKTGVKRWFSCTPKLQELLLSMRPHNPDPEQLVFVGPKGAILRESSFSDRAWKRILTSLELVEKDGIKMTPYNCRDTFITLQAMLGKSSTTIARWVGNSSQVIEKKYLDRAQLEHLRPSDI